MLENAGNAASLSREFSLDMLRSGGFHSVALREAEIKRPAARGSPQQPSQQALRTRTVRRLHPCRRRPACLPEHRHLLRECEEARASVIRAHAGQTDATERHDCANWNTQSLTATLPAVHASSTRSMRAWSSSNTYRDSGRGRGRALT